MYSVEHFDLVDASDQVIGTTDKATAHSLGQWHRIAVVYVFAPDGQLYVQHHKKSGLLDHSVGGHVRKGESYDDAAKREAAEELGVTSPLQHLANYSADESLWKGSVMRHVHGLYECTPPSSWHFQPNDEVEELRLMTIDEIITGINAKPKSFTPGFIFSLAKYLEIKHLHPETLTIPNLDSL